jgi:transposase
MDQFVGLDVSQEMTHLCVIRGDGKIAWQGKCLSTPEDIAGTIRSKAPDVVRIGLESGPFHLALARVEGDGASDSMPRFPPCAGDHEWSSEQDRQERCLRIGPDRQSGLVPRGRRKESRQSRRPLDAWRSSSTRRDAGVEVTNQIRGTLKTFGIVLSRRTGEPFERLVDEACGDGDAMHNHTVRSMMCVYSCLKEQIRKLDRQVMGRARKSAVCQQLMAIPGVGVLTALAFVTAVDDPTKFTKSRSVGAYFGLTPRCHQSGEIDHNRGISKCGDGLVRTYLFEAAGTLLTRVEKWSALKAWGLRLAKRSGLKKAKVAVARKLAVIMHLMWVDGASFRWSAAEPAAAQ